MAMLESMQIHTQRRHKGGNYTAMTKKKNYNILLIFNTNNSVVWGDGNKRHPFFVSTF